ncbi:MAG: hypothetical protein ACXVIM_04335 [Acidimicrobiia bacterium]
MRGLRGWPAIAVLAAVALYFNTEGAAGVVAVAALLGYVCFFAARRLVLGPSGVGEPTGRTLVPVTVPSATAQWGGGAELPWLYDRMHAASPLAVLELSGSSVTIRMRPRLLALGLRAIVTLRAEAVEAVFPIKTPMFGYEGIGLRPLGQPVTYFWTSDREQLLTRLRAEGFPVGWEERLIRQ